MLNGIPVSLCLYFLLQSRRSVMVSLHLVRAAVAVAKNLVTDGGHVLKSLPQHARPVSRLLYV